MQDHQLRVLCAPDKLRGALTATDAATALAAGVNDAGHLAVEHPIADGGEGSRDAILAAVPGSRLVPVRAADALGRPNHTAYGMLPDRTAVVEAADVIGLAALSPAQRDVLAASSAGLAAPVKAAVAADARRIVVLLGGTANMDGGLGLLVALGADARDRGGDVLSGTGRDLTRIAALDLSPAQQALTGIDLVVATDVRSPLQGPDGAAHLFGPQKGADPDTVMALDTGLHHLAKLLGAASYGPGAGAAGGLGAALRAIGGRIVGGADLVLRLTGFDNAMKEASLCITAEGKVDAGTSAGKAVSAVLAASRRADVPCIILGGAVEDDRDLYAAGAAAVLPIGRQPQPLDAALASAFTDLRQTARAVISLAHSVT